MFTPPSAENLRPVFRLNSCLTQIPSGSNSSQSNSFRRSDLGKNRVVGFQEQLVRGDTPSACSRGGVSERWGCHVLITSVVARERGESGKESEREKGGE